MRTVFRTLAFVFATFLEASILLASPSGPDAPPTRKAEIAANAAETSASIGWRHGSEEFREATEVAREDDRSRKSSKPLLVAVGAEGCGPCRTMEETTYRDQTVIEAARSFIPIALDAEKDIALLERLGVKKIPTIMVVGPNGERILRVSGFLSANRLARALRIVSELVASSASPEEIRRAIMPI